MTKDLFARPGRSERGRFTLLLLLIAWLSAGSGVTATTPEAVDPESVDQRVQLVPVDSGLIDQDAAAPGAIQRACGPDLDSLEYYFRQKALPFEPRLVTRISGLGRCHLYYEPTIRGFRADPDNFPIAELHFDVDAPSFAAKRSTTLGDSLDVAKTIHLLTPGGLRFGLSLSQSFEPGILESAKAFHFPNQNHDVALHENLSEVSNPWVQDYLKSGSVGSFRRVLLTRELIEGDITSSKVFQPLLSSFRGEEYVRSKISWEGGDLQFVLDPKDSSRLLMFYGSWAKQYWARNLTPPEYAYVLRAEFGADAAIDFTDLVSHVDYLVAFLPKDNIVLLGEPMRENFQLAQDALRVLKERFSVGAGWDALNFHRIRAMTAGEFRQSKKEVAAMLRDAKLAYWPPVEKPGLLARMQDYVGRHCPDNPADCFTEAGRDQLIRENPALFEEWVTASLLSNSEERLPGRMLSIVESQLDGFRPRIGRNLKAKESTLRELGFNVIRVPRIAGDPKLGVPWSGISYVNSLLVDRTLFVPQFGLGPGEDRIYDELEERLPVGYRVVPVYARRTLLYNGGIHCVVGIVRANPRTGPASSGS